MGRLLIGLGHGLSSASAPLTMDYPVGMWVAHGICQALAIPSAMATAWELEQRDLGKHRPINGKLAQAQYS